MVVAFLVFSFSPALVKVSFENLFLVAAFQRFASFEIMQATWGADFATRFGGTKVTTGVPLAKNVSFWYIQSPNFWGGAFRK